MLTPMATVSTQSDEKILCHCLRITASQIEAAVCVGGSRTVRDVMDPTGAGRGCLACHYRIKTVLNAACADAASQCAAADANPAA